MNSTTPVVVGITTIIVTLYDLPTRLYILHVIYIHKFFVLNKLCLTPEIRDKPKALEN